MTDVQRPPETSVGLPTGPRIVDAYSEGRDDSLREGQQLATQGQQQETSTRVTQIRWSEVLGTTPKKGEFVRQAKETGEPIVGREDRVSEQVLETAKRTVIRILVDPSLAEHEDFQFLRNTINSIYQASGDKNFDISKLNLDTEEGQAKFLQAIDRLFTENPAQATTLGLFALQNITKMIGDSFTFVEQGDSQKKDEKLPSPRELMTSLGLTDFIKLTESPNGDISISLVIPEDLTLEKFKQLYKEKLEEAKKQLRFSWFRPEARAKKELLKSQGLREFTDEELEEIFNTAKKGESVRLFKIGLKTTDQTGQNLSVPENSPLISFLGQQSREELKNLLESSGTTEEKQRVLTIICGLVNDYEAVYNEIRRATGAPKIEGGINEILANSGLLDRSLNVDNITEKIRKEAEERLESAKRKEESETWLSRIRARIAQLEKETSDKKPKETEAITRKRDEALALVEELNELGVALGIRREQAIARLTPIIDNLPDNLRKLFDKDSQQAASQILRLIQGESVYSVFSKGQLETFFGKEGEENPTGLRGEIQSLQDEIATLEVQLSEKSEVRETEEKDKSGSTKKTKTSTSEIELNRIKQKIEQKEQELQILREALRDPRRYLLSSLGIDLTQLDPDIGKYLEQRKAYGNKTTSLSTTISILDQRGVKDLVKKVDLDQQTGLISNLADISTKLKITESQTPEAELEQLRALEILFSQGTSEADALTQVYQRVDQLSTPLNLSYEQDAWGDGANDIGGEIGPYLLYVLFGEKYLEPVRYGISKEEIGRIKKLFTGGQIGGITISNITTIDQQLIESIFANWHSKLLKVKTVTQSTSQQSPQSQP